MHILLSIREFIYNAIWKHKLKHAPRWKKIVFGTLRIAYAVIRDIKDGQLSLRAMSLVYTTVISLVPLLAISFSMLKGFGAHNQVEPMLLKLLEPLGDKKIEITEKLVQFVDNIQVGLLGTVGLALLIYSVIAMMQKIEKSFNYIWHVNKGRTVTQRFSDYLSALLVGPLLMFISIGISVSVSTAGFIEDMAAYPVLGEVITVAGHIIPYFILAGAFAFIYLFIPNTTVRLKSAFIGGIITAVIWKSMGWVFAIFVANSTSGTVIYSAFATLLMFMVWMYIGWLVMLIGSSIAFYHQNPNNMLLVRNKTELSNRIKEKIALMTAQKVANTFYNGETPCTNAKISNEIDMPEWAIEQVVTVFLKAGLFMETNQEPAGYIPSRPLEKIMISEILNAIRITTDMDKDLISDKIHANDVVEKCFVEIDDALTHRISEKSLKDFVS